LAFVRGDPETGSSGYRIWVVPIDQPKKARMLLNTRFNETHPEFSPDGHWIAYLSDESGRREIYVQPYPGPGRRTLVSSELAGDPAWSKDSNELFYLAFTGQTQTQTMMSVHFKVSGNEFLPEKPVVLFEGRSQLGAITRQFDVTSDGRFLMIQRLAEDLVERNKKIFPSTLRIVLNWTAELDRLLAH
jgi:Tol biopolymer transport system component